MVTNALGMAAGVRLNRVRVTDRLHSRAGQECLPRERRGTRIGPRTQSGIWVDELDVKSRLDSRVASWVTIRRSSWAYDQTIVDAVPLTRGFARAPSVIPIQARRTWSAHDHAASRSARQRLDDGPANDGTKGTQHTHAGPLPRLTQAWDEQVAGSLTVKERRQAYGGCHHGKAAPTRPALLSPCLARIWHKEGPSSLKGAVTCANTSGRYWD